ncbi:MAG: L,D-transpeptidase family protein [Opitutales bacterium]
MPLDFLDENGRINERCAALSITPTDRRLVVSITAQKMALIENSAVVKTYTISTSKNPPSCKADSYGTPTGLHAIADKIGKEQPEGLVFKGRVPTGKHFSLYSGNEGEKNLITSRILRLRGLEPDKNAGPGCDSYQRYIYIHGTNHEDRIGQPFSGGCVEMLNHDVIELFERIESGDLVWTTKG